MTKPQSKIVDISLARDLGEAVNLIRAARPDAVKCRLGVSAHRQIIIEPNDNGIMRCDVGFTVAVFFREAV